MLENIFAGLTVLGIIVGVVVGTVLFLVLVIGVASFFMDGAAEKMMDRFDDWMSRKANSIRARHGKWAPRRLWMYMFFGTLFSVSVIAGAYTPGLSAGFLGALAAIVVGMITLPFLLRINVDDEESEAFDY